MFPNIKQTFYFIFDNLHMLHFIRTHINIYLQSRIRCTSKSQTTCAVSMCLSLCLNVVFPFVNTSSNQNQSAHISFRLGPVSQLQTDASESHFSFSFLYLVVFLRPLCMAIFLNLLAAQAHNLNAMIFFFFFSHTHPLSLFSLFFTLFPFRR